MSKVIDNLCQSICSGDIAVLCGAGISRESGLPIVNELVPFILRNLDASAQEETILRNERLPFESFIDTLAAETNINQLIDIYRSGAPNTSHILLAELMKRGYLKTVCSMNFDRLIETSLNNAGLRINVDFDVVYRGSEFDKVDFCSSRPILIKLHGCISDESELGVSIRNVANKASLESRSRIIKQLFSEGPHRGVLVLGYSCSDAFDVSPTISELRDDFKHVLFINHVESSLIELGFKAEDIRKQQDNNPFSLFPDSVRVNCKTGWLVDQIWRRCLSEEPSAVSKQATNWKHQVIQWTQHELGDGVGFISHNILGRLCFKVSEFQLSVHRHNLALDHARETRNAVEAAHTQNLLGAAYGSLMKLDKSEESFRRAMAEGRRLDNIPIEMSALGNLGILYDQIGNHNKSMECRKRGIELAKRSRDEVSVLELTGSLAVSYSLLGEYREAIECFSIALDHAIKSGDKHQEQTHRGNLGVVYRRMDNATEALSQFKKALEISQKLSDWKNEINALKALGNVYGDLNRNEEARKSFLRAKELAEGKGLENEAASALDGLGLLQYKLGEYKGAISIFKAVLEIHRRLGDVKGQQHALDHIGICYAELKEFQLALENHEAAHEIAMRRGNDEAIYLTQANIAFAHAGLGNISTAIKYYTEALTLLVPLLGAEHRHIKEIKKNLNDIK